jgi:hypothetical protein
MARSRESGAKFDSFPFLNVMVGMIVVMLLFIFFILSTRVMEAQEEAAVVAASGGESTEDGSAQAPSSTASDGAGELTEDEYRSLRQQMDDVSAKIAASRATLDELLRARQELEGVLASKEDAALLAGLDDTGGKTGVVLGEPDPTIMIPDESVKISKKPRFFEVSAETFKIHHDSGEVIYPVAELKQRSSAFCQAIAKVDQNRGNEYLLLLVHPNGVEQLTELRKYLLQTHQEQITRPGPIPGLTLIITKCRIDIGTEPFAREWLLVKDKTTGR